MNQLKQRTFALALLLALTAPAGGHWAANPHVHAPPKRPPESWIGRRGDPIEVPPALVPHRETQTEEKEYVACYAIQGFGPALPPYTGSYQILLGAGRRPSNAFNPPPDLDWRLHMQRHRFGSRELGCTVEKSPHAARAYLAEIVKRLSDRSKIHLSTTGRTVCEHDDWLQQQGDPFRGDPTRLFERP